MSAHPSNCRDCEILEKHRSTLTRCSGTCWSPNSSRRNQLSRSLCPGIHDSALVRKWDTVSPLIAHAISDSHAIQLGPADRNPSTCSGSLMTPLSLIFQEHDRSETEHTLATNILADYASDEPERLAELIMVADQKAYVSLFPVAEKRQNRSCLFSRPSLPRKPPTPGAIAPLDPSWVKPDATLVRQIESALGILDERFAFCQTMSIGEAITTADALRKSGYRPVRFRPYADGQTVRVAAIWTRDGRNWRISSGFTAEEIRQQDERNKKDKLLPFDVAGYVTTEKDGKPADRYAALWVREIRR